MSKASDHLVSIGIARLSLRALKASTGIYISASVGKENRLCLLQVVNNEKRD